MQDFHIEKTDKRQHLLNIAEGLFAKYGYEAVSIRQLATEAGINLAMVSYYFGSKEGLFAAIIENKIPRTRDRLEQLAVEHISPWEKISRTVDIYVDSMLSNRNFSRVITREMSTQQRPENVKMIVSQISKNLEIVRGFIREGQESGIFRYVDNEMTLVTFFGTISAILNSGSMICVLLDESQEDIIMSESYKTRVKQHLKALLQAHLMK
ncbi:MAG: TetR/AcrR family transcriptional regulator [Bacteroidota bacterium]